MCTAARQGRGEEEGGASDPGADQGEGTRLVAQLEHAKSHPRATGAYSHLVGEACLGTG